MLVIIQCCHQLAVKWHFSYVAGFRRGKSQACDLMQTWNDHITTMTTVGLVDVLNDSV